jgi:hypothetical protein
MIYSAWFKKIVFITMCIFGSGVYAQGSYSCINDDDRNPKITPMFYAEGNEGYIKIRGKIYNFGLERQESGFSCKTRWFRAGPKDVLSISPAGKDNQKKCGFHFVSLVIQSDSLLMVQCLKD